MKSRALPHPEAQGLPSGPLRQRSAPTAATAPSSKFQRAEEEPSCSTPGRFSFKTRSKDNCASKSPTTAPGMPMVITKGGRGGGGVAAGTVPIPTMLPSRKAAPTVASSSVHVVNGGTPTVAGVKLSSPTMMSTVSSQLSTVPLPPPPLCNEGPKLSSEAQRILRGIRDFTLPFDLDEFSSDEDNDKGPLGSAPSSPNGTVDVSVAKKKWVEEPSSSTATTGEVRSGRVGAGVVQTTAALLTTSLSMACGDDEPIPHEAPQLMNGHSFQTKKSTVTTPTQSNNVMSSSSSMVGAGGDDSGLVGFNVNPLLRRGKDEHGHFSDVLVLEQRITLLPQFEVRGGPLLHAAAQKHTNTPFSGVPQMKAGKPPGQSNGKEAVSPSIISGGDRRGVSSAFLSSVRLSSLTPSTSSTVRHPSTTTGNGDGGTYFTHLIASL